MKRLILTKGDRYGRLTITGNEKQEFTKSGTSKRMVEVLCSCGTLKYIQSTKLSKIESCGCYRKEATSAKFKKEDGYAFDSERLGSYIKAAKKRNYSFDLTREQFVTLIHQNCHYCGSEPSQTMKKYPSQTSNGVDRINSTKGYTLDNCVTCCKICNVMKSNLTVDEFYSHITKILHRR